MKRRLILLLFCLNCFLSSGQNKITSSDSLQLSQSDHVLLDSIVPLYLSAKVDTVKMDLLSGLVNGLKNKTLANRYNDTLLSFVFQTLRNVEKNSVHRKRIESYLAIALNAYGVKLANSGEVVQSIDTFRRALLIRQQLGDSVGVAMSLNNLGKMYANIGDVPNALSHYQRSLDIKEKSNDERGIAVTLNNIGVVYRDIGDTAEAFSYFRRSMEIRERIGDTVGLVTALNNIGTMYLSHEMLDEALENFERSLALSIKLGLQQATGTALSNIGVIYNQRGEYTKSIEQLNKAKTIFERIHDAEGLAQVYYNIGNCYLNQGNGAQAIAYGERSLELSQQLGFPYRIEKAASLLSRAYKSQNNWQRAFDMQKLSTEMRDSLDNVETKKQLLQQRYLNEYNTKSTLLNAQHEAELDRERLWRNGLVIGLVIVLLIAGLIVMAYRQSLRHRKAIADEKKRTDILLRNILPDETAEELKRHGVVKAKYYEQATVLFTDFVDFAKMSSELSAHETVSLIDSYYRAFDKIVEQHNIEKIKTIGDAYMAVGGVPAFVENHAAQTVSAALAIRDYVLGESVRRNEQGLPAFQIRIGVHTGPVVAGVVGAKKFAYDVWGDTVNLAARMEQNSIPGKVNISDSTYGLIKNMFNVSQRGQIEIKHGISVEMYFVESVTEKVGEEVFNN